MWLVDSLCCCWTRIDWLHLQCHEWANENVWMSIVYGEIHFGRRINEPPSGIQQQQMHRQIHTAHQPNWQINLLPFYWYLLLLQNYYYRLWWVHLHKLRSHTKLLSVGNSAGRGRTNNNKWKNVFKGSKCQLTLAVYKRTGHGYTRIYLYAGAERTGEGENHQVHLHTRGHGCHLASSSGKIP